MKAEDICSRIKEALPTAQIEAVDLTGGGDHWRLKVVAEEFQGKTLIQQHQMVYRALGDWMKEAIHALSLDTSAS